MRPDAQLSGLLGIASTGGNVSNAYLQVDTTKSPGQGITGATMQFHGTADDYALFGASKLATLYSDAATATTYPAVTLRTVGTQGGQAAAFTYDLARSVVYTRQGNPAWSGQERDGQAPIRSDDLFFGASTSDPQPDWVNLTKVAIPQADEQQRLFANLVLQMESVKKPLPRFWYLPRGNKAVVVMTGDDHGNGGTAGRFDQQLSESTAGCDVTKWECVRSTSYIYTSTPLTNAAASTYNQQGFEIGLHVSTDCADWTPTSLANTYNSQLADWHAKFPSLPTPVSNRTHCIPESDYSTQPHVELANGMRFDTNYYYWPPSWIQDRPGMFTGSGFPMRFADPDGSLIDVYQATTQMTDESGQSYPATINALLDNALGLLRRVHREHAHRQRNEQRRGCDHRVGSGPQRADRVCPPDARLARRAQRLVVLVARVERTRSDVRCGSRRDGQRLAGDAADDQRRRCTAHLDHAGGRQRAVHRPDDQRRRVRFLRQRDRQLHGDIHGRHDTAGDLGSHRGRGDERRRDRHVDDRRALHLADRVRHDGEHPRLGPDRSGRRHLALDHAARAHGGYEVLLPCHVRRSRRQQHDCARLTGPARVVHGADVRGHRYNGRRLLCRNPRHVRSRRARPG
jgi:hypothetical protein